MTVFLRFYEVIIIEKTYSFMVSPNPDDAHIGPSCFALRQAQGERFFVFLERRKGRIWSPVFIQLWTG